MSENIDFRTIALFIGLISGVSSGVVSWLYGKRTMSPQGHCLTHWQKYGQPAITLALTNLVTAVGFNFAMVYQNNDIQTSDDWLTVFISFLGCFSCLFTSFVLVYLNGVVFYSAKSRLEESLNKKK